MHYLTRYYKNLSEDLQAKVNFLSSQVKLLTEADDAGGAGEANPYMPPNWTAPELNPNQPTSPQPPQDFQGFENNNPAPLPGNYPGGSSDPDYIRDLQKWEQALARAKQNYYEWMRNQRGINRGYGGLNRTGPNDWRESPLPSW